MNQKNRDAVLASFVADALSLGVHWVYDTSEIDNKYGRLERMVKPELAPYHMQKGKGAFTHYGDQMMVLLESVKSESGFDPDQFASSWQEMFQSYDGYLDHASKETLDNGGSGRTADQRGSSSQDLGGAARIAPLALYYQEDVYGFVNAARAQTAMTHNHPQVIDCAELFARTSVMVFQGESPSAALEKSFEAMPEAVELQQMVRSGLESRTGDTREAIGRFGQMCSVPTALPGTVHLIAKYEDNLKEALVENINAGGDSSARGMLAGFILGAYQGLETIPDSWFADMAAHKKISALLQNFCNKKQET
ncbi:MAG: ADP-ribosylglycohydrolase family protein [Deltaproteobacteria bacterium]|nr:ADP-ribosylglycohydrolase family protein [Deltaproteobacteria bacterium]